MGTRRKKPGGYLNELGVGCHQKTVGHTFWTNLPVGNKSWTTKTKCRMAVYPQCDRAEVSDLDCTHVEVEKKARCSCQTKISACPRSLLITKTLSASRKPNHFAYKLALIVLVTGREDLSESGGQVSASTPRKRPGHLSAEPVAHRATRSPGNKQEQHNKYAIGKVAPDKKIKYPCYTYSCILNHKTRTSRPSLVCRPLYARPPHLFPPFNHVPCRTVRFDRIIAADIPLIPPLFIQSSHA